MYWIPLFQGLETRGMDVCLVNAHHAKNVPGRRTDVSDCQWLQYLHSVGAAPSTFRPAQEVCAERTLLRQNEGLVQMASGHTQHMQKALDQMNLQIHHVLSDITGLTGLAIIEAISNSEPEPRALAKLRDWRVRASEEIVALREEATENTALVCGLLSELLERGVDFSIPRLYILDGAKALAASLAQSGVILFVQNQIGRLSKRR